MASTICFIAWGMLFSAQRSSKPLEKLGLVPMLLDLEKNERIYKNELSLS